ncbi:MAG: AmmeMemoRadiSam system protein B, partial [Nitrospinota bacterium]
MDRPRLRPLEAVPGEQQGRRAIILRDPLHLSEAVLVVPLPLVTVLQRLDGRHTLAMVREECLAAHGLDLPEENLRLIAAQLEEAHFLDGEGFEAWRRSLEREFLASPVRPSFLAGRSYEADPAALRARLDGFFTDSEGPGLPRMNGANGAPLRGLVAPHIDFHRGGPTFAWSYRALAERSDADLFVVLGTVHAPTQGFYTLTEKAFETPLGTLYVTITEDDRSQPFEVFMSLGKAGGALMADVEALGRL